MGVTLPQFEFEFELKLRTWYLVLILHGSDLSSVLILHGSDLSSNSNSNRNLELGTWS